MPKYVDENEPPVREALVKNADNVTSDLHIACRIESDRLRAVITELQQDVERLQQQRAEQVLTNERLRAVIEAYLENDSQANWDALAALVSSDA